MLLILGSCVHTIQNDRLLLACRRNLTPKVSLNIISISYRIYARFFTNLRVGLCLVCLKGGNTILLATVQFVLRREPDHVVSRKIKLFGQMRYLIIHFHTTSLSLVA